MGKSVSSRKCECSEVVSLLADSMAIRKHIVSCVEQPSPPAARTHMRKGEAIAMFFKGERCVLKGNRCVSIEKHEEQLQFRVTYTCAPRVTGRFGATR